MIEDFNDITIENKPKKGKVSFKDILNDISHGGKYLVITVITTFIIMVAACLAVFFASVRGAEQVMMPNVTGKPLTTALLELQSKELYPKIQLKYSDKIGDEDTILSQNPDAGSIVKAYRQVTLTVSRGMAIDSIGDYTGQNYGTVKTRLDTLFSGEDPLIKVASPVYIHSSSPEGTVIAQFPQEGTQLISPVTLTLIVSGGEEEHTVSVPDMKGLSLAGIYKAMQESELVFNFNEVSDADYNPGEVVYQETSKGIRVPSYSRIDVSYRTEKSSDSNIVYGILKAQLQEYPFPVPVRLEERTTDGNINTLVSFSHPGQLLTVPYKTTKGSTLNLYVLDELVQTVTVE